MPKDVRPTGFVWEKASPLYTLDGTTATYNAGGTDEHRPVLGSLVLGPQSGRVFYEFRVNCDNARVGVALPNAPLDGVMGKCPGIWSVNLQTGAVEHNGKELKRLWRIVTPCAGAVCGFLFDGAEGTLQLFLNDEFHGTAVTANAGLKGATVVPCFSVAGIEANNRDIGFGKKGAFINFQPKPYRSVV